jgi:calcium-dependent protein kinase
VKNDNAGVATLLQVLRQESISEKKRQGHVEALKREIAVLARLKGSLNCVELEGVYEDSDNIHIVMELCKGGELLHAVGTRHYSERTVRGHAVIRVAALHRCAGKHIQKHLHALLLLRVQVASYMRGVLRTIAQCHAHHILHRDIKPGMVD